MHKELREKEVIKNKSKNRRDNRFFIDTSDPVILIPQKLETIIQAFREWLKESEIKWLKVRETFNKSFDKIFVRINPESLSESDAVEFTQSAAQYARPYVYYAPMLILRMIAYSVTEHALVRWINLIHDKNILNELISNAFSRLAFLNKCYIDYLNDNGLPDLETMPLQSAVVGKGLSLLQSMYVCRKISIEMGLEKQTEQILDLLWEFNKDILKFLFPEIESDSKYGVNSWKKLLRIYEKHPDQTLHNMFTPM
jgi:hypothetical protein